MFKFCSWKILTIKIILTLNHTAQGSLAPEYNVLIQTLNSCESSISQHVKSQQFRGSCHETTPRAFFNDHVRFPAKAVDPIITSLSNLIRKTLPPDGPRRAPVSVTSPINEMTDIRTRKMRRDKIYLRERRNCDVIDLPVAHQCIID